MRPKPRLRPKPNNPGAPFAEAQRPTKSDLVSFHQVTLRICLSVNNLIGTIR